MYDGDDSRMMSLGLGGSIRSQAKSKAKGKAAFVRKLRQSKE